MHCPQKSVGRISPLQRIANKGKLEAAGKLFGKLLLVPVQRQVSGAPAIEQRSTDTAAGTFGHVDEQAGTLREGPWVTRTCRHRLVHHLTIHNRQPAQQEMPSRLGQQLPEISLQHCSTRAKGMALTIEVKIRSRTLTSALPGFIQVWSRNVRIWIQVCGRIARRQCNRVSRAHPVVGVRRCLRPVCPGPSHADASSSHSAPATVCECRVRRSGPGPSPESSRPFRWSTSGGR